MATVTELEKQRAQVFYQGLPGYREFEGKIFVVDGKPARVKIGYISTTDLKDLNIPMKPENADYPGKPCVLVVETDEKPIKAVPLLQHHLDQAEEAAEQNGDRWGARLKIGVSMLQETGVLELSHQSS
jgi:hypothetical protein